MKRRTPPLAQFADDYLPSEFIQPLNVQWIDGSPMFRQTFDVSEMSAGEGQVIIAGNIVAQMIRIFGVVNNNSGAFVNAPYGTTADADYAVLFSGPNNSFTFETSANTLQGSILVCEFTQGLVSGGGDG